MVSAQKLINNQSLDRPTESPDVTSPHKRPQIHWGTLEAPRPARIKMGNLSTTKMARIKQPAGMAMHDSNLAWEAV